jgi:CRP-like cAMP-binding protein
VIPLTQEVLAEMAGSTRQTVNQVLREEQERGTVELRRGKTVVLDAAELARRAR